LVPTLLTKTLTSKFSQTLSRFLKSASLALEKSRATTLVLISGHLDSMSLATSSSLDLVRETKSKLKPALPNSLAN